MASRHRPQTESLETLREGDFQRISGIGPGIEQRLKAAEIKTFRQLSLLSVEDLIAILSGVVGITRERVTQQDWIGQARQLADALEKMNKPPQVEDSTERQHYQSYMIELLLDENQQVRRTRINHVQSGKKDNWQGWDPARTTRWIAAQAGLPESDFLAETATAEEAKPAPAGQPPQPTNPFELRILEIQDTAIRPPSHFHTAGQHAEVCLGLDLSRVNIPDGTAFCYQASIEARRLGMKGLIRLGMVRGKMIKSEQAAITVPVMWAQSGTYRLQATVLIYPPDACQPEAESLRAAAETGLVQVFER